MINLRRLAHSLALFLGTAPAVPAQFIDASPRGGPQRGMASSPRNPNLTIAVRADGRIVRSADAGQSFVAQPVTVDGDRVHLGIDVLGIAFVASESGVWVSRDSAQTWVFQPSPIGPIRSFTVSPVTHDEVWALTVDGTVHRSSDGAVSWVTLGHAAQPALAMRSPLVLNPARPNEIYVLDGSSVWVSTDRGIQWTQEFFPGGHTKAFAADGDHWATVWLIGGHDPYVDIGFSADSGASWSYPYFISWGVQPPPLKMWQDPSRPGEFHGIGIGKPTIYVRSLDRGATWTGPAIGKQDLRFSDVSVPSGTTGTMLLSSRLGILSLDGMDDNVSRATLATGDFAPLPVAEYSVDPTNDAHRVATYTSYSDGRKEMFLESFDAGATWAVEDRVTVGGTEYDLWSSTIDQAGRVVSTTLGRILRRTGGVWETLDPGHNVLSFAVGTLNPDLLVVLGSGSGGTCSWSTSTDGGATWSTTPGCGHQSFGDGFTAIKLIERAGRPLRIVASTRNGLFSADRNVWISDDLGATFINIANEPSGLVLTQSASHPERLAIGFNQLRPVEVSTDGFDTLAPVGISVATSRLAIGGASQDLLVRVEASATGGDRVLESSDLGQTWAIVSDPGTPLGSVFELTLLPDGDRYFLAGTHGVVERVLEPIVSDNYCTPSVPNSTGVSASIHALGSLSIAADELRLEAYALPSGAAAMFLASQTMDLVPAPGGSAGTLCLGGSIGRYSSSIQFASTGGLACIPLDPGAIAHPSGSVPAMAGERWNYQAWYRDTLGGTATSNFTDGATLVWLP